MPRIPEMIAMHCHVTLTLTANRRARSLYRRYTRADESRVKELRLQLEKITLESQRQKHLLDQEVMNTKSHELGLDKIAELYKEAHATRNGIIESWESTMKQMQDEDDSIESAAEAFQQLKTESNGYAISIVEENEFYENEKKDNATRHLEVEKFERTLARLEDERTKGEAQLARFRTELDSLKNVNSRVAADEVVKQRDVAQLQDSIAAREKQHSGLEEQVLKIQERLGDHQKTNLSVEEQTKILEAQGDAERRREEKATNELSTASILLSKEMQTVHALQQENAVSQSEISAMTQTDKNMASNIRMMERQALKEQQIMYKQDFQVTVLERKLLRLKGSVSEDEKRQMQAELESLRENLAGHSETKRLLTTQLRKVEDDTRLSKRKHDKVAAQHATTAEKLADTELYNKGATKELETTVREKQNLMVDENLLKLEVRRLRKRLNAKADDVLSLEQRKLQLKMAMEERLNEISTHKELITVQKMECTRRRAAVQKELDERKTRVEQLRKKFDIVSFALKGPEGEEDHSQAYLIVKMAQERQELQQQGDELDTKICKREKEIRMLDNTLQLMNGHNQKYRNSLRKVDAESDDLATKEHLEGQLRTALDKYKHKRRELRIKQEDLEGMQLELDACRNELDKSRYDHSMMQGELQNLQQELDDQEAKKDRAAKRAEKMVASYRKDVGGLEGETVAEKDFRLRQIKEFNTKIMDQIDGILGEHPDLRPMVAMLYDRAGITRPAARPGTGSSRGSSISSYRSGSTAASRASARSTASNRSRTSRTKAATAAEAAAAHQSRRAATPKTLSLGL